ncbi:MULTISPECIES: hypothetical protein [Streptomyces]|uniref:hypothetical protein n=1 Tax=Streptomyces TaxID=1883 RepID=UPI0021A6872B|nr:hypothetical protein [Streptomyces atratus]MCT2546944.1 hypothetical protein [Streptomyces atratus]
MRDLFCRVIVVADACRDGTAAIARRRSEDLQAKSERPARRAAATPWTPSSPLGRA